MCGHPSKSKAKVAGVYLLNSPVVYLAISSPVIPGIQLGGTLGPAYPGSDGLQEAALCKVVSGKGLSSAEACLERSWSDQAAAAGCRHSADTFPLRRGVL